MKSHAEVIISGSCELPDDSVLMNLTKVMVVQTPFGTFPVVHHSHSNPVECENYVERLQRAADALSSDNRRLRKVKILRRLPHADLRRLSAQPERKLVPVTGARGQSTNTQ